MGCIWFFTSDPHIPEAQVGAPELWISNDVQVSDEVLRKDFEYLLKEKEVGVSSAVQSVKIKLLGIIEENGKMVAVIELDKKSQRVAIGDSFQDGSVLDTIVDNSIMISNDREVRVISLYEKEL